MKHQDVSQSKAVREWVAMVEAQARSEQSAAQFCREQGIAYSLFLYHRDKIQKIKRQESGEAKPRVLLSMKPRRGFLPVKVERLGCVRVRFPNGVVVESEALPEAGWVAEVARSWESEVSVC